MKQRKLLATLLMLVMMLCLAALAACEPAKTVSVTGITLDASKVETLRAGETLDTEKLKVTAQYSDNTQKDVAVKDVTILLDGEVYSGGALTEGEHTLRVSYTAKEGAEALTAEVKIIVEHTHVYGDVHTGAPATCTAAGTKDYYECACGKKFVKDGETYTEITDIAIPALGHDFEHGTEVEGSRRDATCTTAGEYTVKCSRCDETQKIDIPVDPDAHDFDGQAYVADGENGHYRVCKHNEAHHSNTEAHTGGTATCKVLAACDKCGASYGEYAGHTYGTTVPAKAPTIDEAGNVEYRDCTVCGKHFDKDGREITDVVLPKLESVTITLVDYPGMTSKRIEKGTALNLAEPRRKGYLFVKYTKDGADFDMATALDSDATITVVWNEGYDFKKDSDGAGAVTSTDGAEQGSLDMVNAADSNGLRYWLPTNDALYDLVFPKIDYTMYKAVNFTWRTRSYVLLNTIGYTDNCWTNGADIAGNVEVIVDGSKLLVIVTGPNNYRKSAIVEDPEVINGTKGLCVMNATNWAASTWFDIAVKSLHHEYTANVDWSMPDKISLSDNCKNTRVEDGTFIFECQDKTDSTLNSQDYTFTLPKFDFTGVSKVSMTVYFNNINGEGGTISIGGTVISPSSVTDNTFALEFRNEDGTVKVYADGTYMYTLTVAQANGTEAISGVVHVAHPWNVYVTLKISAMTITL